MTRPRIKPDESSPLMPSVPDRWEVFELFVREQYPALCAYALRYVRTRELAEEVFIDAQFSERCVGLINDDETEVGKVHLGVVHVFDVERPAVRSRETDLIESGFRPVAELLEDLTGFETWSAICLRALFA